MQIMFSFKLFFVFVALTVTKSFRFSHVRSKLRCCDFRQSSSLMAGIDVSGLTWVPVPEEFQNIPLDTSSQNIQFFTTDDVQNLLIILCGVSYIVYEKRPRGSAKSEWLEIRKSSIPNANLGVFCKAFIPEGTTIGTFPGFLSKMESALASKNDDKARQRAQKYMWAIDDTVLDPTNKEGNLELELLYLSGLVKVNTMLARVNEPPIGGDCNLYSKVENGEVQIITDRDIFVGEELFMDYGNKYDRSDYQDLQKKLEREIAEDRLRDESLMMQLEPITTSDPEDAPAGPSPTTMPDGFISKLGRRQGDSKLEKAGILSPEEGAKLFTELGSTMFGSDEDKELMRSLVGKADSAGSGDGKGNQGILRPEDASEILLGKKSINADPEDEELIQSLLGKVTQAGEKRNSGIISAEEGAALFGVNIGGKKGAGAAAGDDDDLMNSLVQQLGTDNMKNLDSIPDFAEARLRQATQASGGVSANPASRGEGAAVDRKGAGQQEIASSVTGQSVGATAAAAAVEGKPFLSPDEVEDLQKRLDEMTDEQVEGVFAKLRVAVGQRLQGDVASALQEKRGNSASDTSDRQMPRAAVLDPTVRAKYNRELTAIEDELEKLYKDPLGVWQELVTNPDKFTKDTGGKSLDGDEEFQ